VLFILWLGWKITAMILPLLLKIFVVCFCIIVILAIFIAVSEPKITTQPVENQNADSSVSVNLN
jgi:uncharacterized membrane protein